MKDHDIRALFRQTDMLIKTDVQKKARTRELLQRTEKENRGNRISSKIQLLKSRLYYMDKKIWLTDGFVHAVFVLLLTAMRFYGASADAITAAAMLSASVMGLASVLILADLLTSGIAELTDTCYFNMKQLAGLEMLMTGIMNLTVLSFAVCYVSTQWKICFFRIGIYMGVPFLITVSACLGCLLTDNNRNKTLHLTAAGIISAAATFVLASVPALYTPSAIAVWCIGFATGLSLLYAQVKQLFAAISEGEIICIN